MMRRANIGIKGNVQMAGFRTFIENIADSLNVTGFAENQEDGSVKVVCEGKEEGINELINSIKENTPSFASIEEMNEAYEEYKGEFTGFERRGADVPKEDKEDALLRYMQSFDKKGEVMINILSSMNETLKSVKEDTSQIKQDTSQIKQDTSQIKQDTSQIKQDTSNILVKQDMMLEKQDDTTEEIRALREDLKSYMENKFAKIEYEIAGIKAKIGMM
ncbi:MAG: acylphosphatase [Halobacteriota archaeon]